MNATSLKVAGGSTADCMSPAAEFPPVDDPLAAIQGPNVGSCDFNGNDAVYNGNGGPPITFNPGVYCGNGIKINTDRPVTEL